MRQRRIPVSEPAEPAAAAAAKDTRAVQLEWVSNEGAVGLVLKNLPAHYLEKLVRGLEPTLDGNAALVLVIGSTAGGEDVGKLNGATLALNRTLRELWK